MIGAVFGDVGAMADYGLTVDLINRKIREPALPLDKLTGPANPPKRERTRLRKKLGDWGELLTSCEWFGVVDNPQADVEPLSLQVYHVPDLPVDDLADSHLEHAVCLTVGWNFVRMFTPGQMKLAIADLRRALVEAETIITF
jgi:hypothetical protein